MSSSIAVRRSRASSFVVTLAVVLYGVASFLAAPSALAAQEPVGLGAAESFSVLAGSGITNTGPTTITGDVGTFPTPSETGFGSVTLHGTNHAGDAVTQAAKDDLVSAYNDAAGRTPVTNVPVELGGSTLLAGVYTSGTFGLTGTLTLDAQGNTDARFIFQADTTLITASNSRVLLINEADPCNVVWKVGSSATFNTGTRFVGDVLALTSITAQTSATFEGRLLARNGAVTMDTNTITNADCAPPSSVDQPAPTATETPSASTGTSTPSASPTPIESGNGIESPNGIPDAAGPPGATTPGTPSTPPSLVVTGVAILGLLGVGLGLMNIGGIARVSGRRRRKARIVSRKE
jgi:ice-binding like protein